jgi:anti-sigma regulatory factor (Ser/Thr protein kinase)
LRDPAAADGGFRHVAWFYRTPGEYAAAADEFMRAGIARDEPLFAALPGGQLPAGSQVTSGAAMTLTDMCELGRNPARLIPAIRSFGEGFSGRRIRFLGESAWPGRSTAELSEAGRHEALLNLAFAGAEISILCPYDVASLPAAVIAAARSTHPFVRSGDDELDNPDYLEPAGFLAKTGQPLVAPELTETLAYDRDLRPVRALVAAVGQRAGMDPARRTDLVIAASEVAANTLRHTRSGGLIRLWTTDDEVLCQIEDTGFIADPLAGRWRSPADAAGRQGLWLVNQVCDLAEIRTSELGTTVRLHMLRNLS